MQNRNIQDTFLNIIRKSGSPVNIFVTNGFMIKNAKILGYDNFAVLIESEGKTMLVYKHAISSIDALKKVELFDENSKEE